MTADKRIDNGGSQPRFAVGMRGYDRAQVGAYIADGARWAAQAWDRIVHLEGRVSELEGGEAPRLVREDANRTVADARRTVDRFVEQVDAKAAELDAAVANEARPQLDELRQHVEELEDERRLARAELAALRESLNGLARGIRGDNGRSSELGSGRLEADGGSLATAVIPPDFGSQ